MMEAISLSHGKSSSCVVCSLYRWIRCWYFVYCQIRDSSVVSILNYPNDIWGSVVLFHKVVELSGGGALLEKEAQSWVGLEVFQPSPIFCSFSVS